MYVCMYVCIKETDEASREAAKKLYGGPAFSEEPYADWAVDVRNHAERLRNMLD